ncbi:LysR family transcriptional regulator [Marinomonas arenicola]|mgnify:CR=1 FL=1|uniref:LysR family transcriptional regulator n=1 Tax=Marinomonas TaxID=28253 RepID=UPI0010566AC6|nr:LysR family transcriptional regulator [Marinomonas sp. KMM3893]
MKPRYSLDDLRCFCSIAHLGSFKNAAQSLGMPLSTLSRRIRQLELDLQLRLLNRDAHKVVLTSTGKHYFQRFASLFDEIDEIDIGLHQDKYRPQGKIRISSPINLGSQLLRTIFYDFLIKYPDIQLDLSSSNSLIDIEEEAIDVVFRVGDPVVENWVARPLKDIHFILCAHPNFDIADIAKPENLSGHASIICRPMTPWYLVQKETGESFDYYPHKNVRLEVDEILMLTHAVKAGLGIGYVPDYFAQPMIEQGEIKHVLPDWHSKARTLFMLYRDRDHMPMRVRLFIDFAMAYFE